MTTILITDDDAPLRDMLRTSLVAEGFDVLEASSAAAAQATLQLQSVDVLLTDVRLGPGPSGIELAASVRALYPTVPVLAMTGFGDLETAIRAIRAGAYDFIPKPLDVDDLVVRVRRAAEWRELRAEVRRLREDRAGGVVFESIVGRSPAMESVYAMIERVAQTDASVLVTGDTGTGKELVARALHARAHARGPLVAINCAAMPEHLLEAELFGHVKGAFTDARGSRAGLFVQANGGTLFLDEIGEMPVSLQPKILRALQERTVRPLGSDEEVPFDARIVSATHRDLESRVAEGLFREDLFYRLNVVEIRLPALRSRGPDILLIAQDLLNRIAARNKRPPLGIDPTCARYLLDYPWPGNVRELANVMERAAALTRHDTITVADLPAKLQRADRADVIIASTDPGELVTLDEVERRYILKVLEAVGGHRIQAAQILGIDRKTLYSKLKSYGPRGSVPPDPNA